MSRVRITVKLITKLIRLSIIWITPTLVLAGCVISPVAASKFQSLPEAVTIPYRVSSEGRFIIDIAVNDERPMPFIVDTGATVSTLYERGARALQLGSMDESMVIRGLVAIDARPTISDIRFQIGTKTFQLDRIAILENPSIPNEAIGLLGTDVLADQTVIFDSETMTAVIAPSRYVASRTFGGWRRIPLSKRVGTYPDFGLHFAQTTVQGTRVPVLIDTGSELNIVNWPLATLDEDMRRFRRRLREQEELQGAIDTSRLRVETRFNNLVIGRHIWPRLAVVILELEALSTVFPADEPMMIAGSRMFAPMTIAIDFGGDMLYIRPNSDEPISLNSDLLDKWSSLMVPAVDDVIQ